MKNLFTIIIACSLLAAISCKKDDPGGGSGDLSGQSFSVYINDSLWTTTQVLYTYQPTGLLGKTIGMQALSLTNETWFQYQVAYFSGSDTTISGSGLLLIFYQENSTPYGVFNQSSGNLHMTKSVSGGVETITGSFSGDFHCFAPGGGTKTMTNGQFVAKRKL